MTYCDTRYGGIPRWSENPPEDAGMRFVDEFKQNACFICVEDKHGDKHICGTAFFVWLASDSVPTKHHTFVITARHTIEELRKSYSHLYLRMNTPGGNADYFQVDTNWLFSPLSDYFHSDAAVKLVSIRSSYFEYGAFPIELCLTPELVRSKHIGIGDDLYIIGLFKKREGRRRNIPVLRTGIIAAMPEEEIPTTVRNAQGEEEIKYYHAYLAEIRSTKGLSGSPVYVMLTAGRPVRDENGELKTPKEYAQHNELFILGLVRGHWDIEAFETVIDFVNGGDEETENTGLNSGIATVTPMEDVLAIINGDEMMKLRREKELEHVKHRETTNDVAIPKPSNTPAITQGDFEDALKRASRKVSDSEDRDKGDESR